MVWRKDNRRIRVVTGMVKKFRLLLVWTRLQKHCGCYWYGEGYGNIVVVITKTVKKTQKIHHDKEKKVDF